ncbi:MAG: hypothetical protein ACJAUP_001312 [Cellvibrionaceae bacterium]|jgi:hypothetical protein
MRNPRLLLLLLLLSGYLSAETLAPFVSDGCSAFPNGIFKQNKLWLSCCQQHDYDYWKGGTYKERVESDRALKACVSDVGELEIALLMQAGVRVGGTPFLPTTFRWGYGWSYPRLYGALSTSELKQVEVDALEINGLDQWDQNALYTLNKRKEREQ